MSKLETTHKGIRKVPNQKTKGTFPVIGFLIMSLLVLCSLYTCSWLSVLDTFIVPLTDTSSKIRVNYSPWVVAEVHQLDISIIKEVEEDRGDGVDLETLTVMENQGWFWGTPAPPGIPTEAPATPTVQNTATYTVTLTATATETLITPTETSQTQTATATLIPTNTPIITQTQTLLPSATPTTSVPSTPTSTLPSGTIINSLTLETSVEGDWLAPELALGEHDNLCASSDLTETGIKVHKWKISGFDIPDGATITGLEVVAHYSMKVDRLEINLSPDNTKWGSTKLLNVRHSTPRCNNAADDIQGSSTDLWGGTWTPANINDDVFIRLTASKDEEGKEIFVDYVRLTIYYIP